MYDESPAAAENLREGREPILGFGSLFTASISMNIYVFETLDLKIAVDFGI